ncbi:nitrate- and nitrite sensing domain-containing protein [Actinomadura sp. 6N118]|uniref:sensor histidine kinase n=1 Tax=Actinomadura sp. 6N118 TaxID=3375151 RepID=UPI00379507A5
MRITLLVLVPLLALVGLWSFVTGITFTDARQLLAGKEFQDKTVLPTQDLIAALQKERRLSLWQIGTGGAQTSDRAALEAQRRVTDRAREKIQRNTKDGGLRGELQAPVVRRMDAFVLRMGALDAVRRTIDADVAERTRTLEEFAGMIDAGFAIYSAVAPGNADIAMDARTLTTIGRAREVLSREDALLTGALAAGRFTATERATFAQMVGAQRYLYFDSTPQLAGADLVRYRAAVESPQFAQLRSLEDQAIRSSDPAEQAGGGQNGSNGANNGSNGGTRNGTGTNGRPNGGAESPARTPAPVDAVAWRTTADAVMAKLFEFENAQLDSVTKRATDIAIGVLLRLLIAGGLGLIAIVVSTYIAFRIARRLLRECRTLASRVVDFTQLRLPDLARQVRDGQPAEPGSPQLDADLPDYDYRINEIRQIAESFTRARDAVLVAAAGEVAAREGISEVFVNLARRNQALLHRQLSLLDTMERRTEDPSELGDLFSLDHLATRMRRHAEGLVILAGKSAGRSWRRPVPLVDVIRGAVAEVEDYTRVRVEPMPRLALRGAAVADVIHLLAEIVENATSYSPPTAPVQIAGHQVASGFVIEVEDRGLGMSAEQVEAANARLAEPPEFDPADSAQLGLFVVARLARRHDIMVTLRPSPYGGTTAIALIPTALIVPIDEPEPPPPSVTTTGPMRALPQNVDEPTGAEPTNGVVRLVAELPQSSPVRDWPAVRTVPQSAPEPEPASSAPVSAPAPEPESALRAPEPEQAPRAPAVPQEEGELPRRRRQSHLAPQLKERVDADLAAERQAADEIQANGVPAASMPLAAPVPPANGHPPPEDPARSPEAMRSMMTAMQRGWQRGRDEAAQADSTDRTQAEQEDERP